MSKLPYKVLFMAKIALNKSYGGNGYKMQQFTPKTVFLKLKTTLKFQIFPKIIKNSLFSSICYQSGNLIPHSRVKSHSDYEYQWAHRVLQIFKLIKHYLPQCPASAPPRQGRPPCASPPPPGEPWRTRAPSHQTWSPATQEVECGQS